MSSKLHGRNQYVCIFWCWSNPDSAWNVQLLKEQIESSVHSWQGHSMCSLWSYHFHFFNAPMPSEFPLVCSWHMSHIWLSLSVSFSSLPKNRPANMIIQHSSDGQIKLRLSDFEKIYKLHFFSYCCFRFHWSFFSVRPYVAKTKKKKLLYLRIYLKVVSVPKYYKILYPPYARQY